MPDPIYQLATNNGETFRIYIQIKPDLHRFFRLKTNQLRTFESPNRLEGRFDFANLSQSQVKTLSNRFKGRTEL